MADDMTIAESIAAGERGLHRLGNAGIGPDTQMYASLVQESIAHTLIAIAKILDGQERPAVPGLPKGYEIVTQQAPEGRRKWRYVLAGPQFSYASRYRYDVSETALGAGIQYAREQEQQRSGLAPLLEAAREGQALNEPVRVNGERTDVYGIANPEVD